MHIPEPRRHLVRYYAWYSNVSRGKRRKADAEQEEGGGVRAGASPRADRGETRDARAMRRCWARLIKRNYEVDPLVCPSCGGTMKVIAFITEHAVVDAIQRHLAAAEAKSPRGPPGPAALSVAS